MIMLVAAWLLVCLAAACGASLLRVRGIVSFALAVAVLAFAEIVAISHALSLVGEYTRGWFFFSVAALAGVTVCVTAVVRPRGPDLGRFGAAARELAGDPVVTVLAVVVLLELWYLTALALFTPPTEGDVNSYHLTRAIFWIQQHRIGAIPGATDPRIDEIPPNAEIAQGATMLLSGSVRWVGFVQLASLVVAVLAIYGTACRIGFARRSAAFGALLFPTLTVVALQAPTALNDLVVAALVVAVAYFTLGRTWSEIGLAGAALALLVGTKPTGLLAVPLLFLVCVLTYRGKRLVAALAVGIAGIGLGATWYAVVTAGSGSGSGVLGDSANASGYGGGVLSIAARTTRYLVETLEVPVEGRNLGVYGIAAVVVAIGGLAFGRRRLLVLGAAALTLLPLAVPTLERVMYSVYWHGWTFVGYPEATVLGADRGNAAASSMASWYGPVGLALTLVSVVVVTRRAARRTLPWVAAVLAWSPTVVLVGTSFIVAYHPLDGRYAMGGVTLGAATWGVLRGSSAAAVATVAVAATTVAVALVVYDERPMGIGLLEPAKRTSIWRLPPAWSRNMQPEISRMVAYLDANAAPGTTIAVTPIWWVYPFTYVGWPDIEHRIAYAKTLREATNQRAAWAVLPWGHGCVPGWEPALRSQQWAVYRHVPGRACRSG